jgi:SAM-dependent methyltransferase
MAPAHKSQFQEPNAARHAWWASPLGSALIAAESQLLGEALEDVFGWELLQIGAWGSGRELLSGARTRHQAILAPPGVSSSADIRGRPTQLPIVSDSIDAVLLPHILEFATDPYAIVREADRVLVGEGQLLVLGFRPWSLWGVRARWSRSGFPPGTRRVLSERRIREWLVLLGYEVVSAQHYLYRGPWSGGLAAGQEMGYGTGRMLRRGLTYPLPANAYLLKARKRVYTLTPVRPRFRERPAVLGGLVKPTPRQRA